MNKRKGSMVLLSSLLAVSLSLVISSPLDMVWASSNGDDFREIKKANIGIKDDIIKTIFFETRGEIPTDGSGGAFGYGVVMNTGDAIVTTSHAGVLDSEKQQSILDPVWHNHFVYLEANQTCLDEGLPGPAVKDITFESPGKVIIDENTALLKNLPEKANTLLTNKAPTAPYIIPGTDINIVASFSLVPLIDLTNPEPLRAVCVADIQPVDERYVNIFEIKNHYGYGSNEYYPSYYEDRHNYRGEYHENDYRNNYDYKNEHRR